MNWIRVSIFILVSAVLLAPGFASASTDEMDRCRGESDRTNGNYYCIGVHNDESGYLDCIGYYYRPAGGEGACNDP